MADTSKAPEVSNRFACIVDRNASALAAVLSSYLFAQETYLPLFLFPSVTVPKTHDPAFMTEGYVANLMAAQDSILIANALSRMGEPEYLILGGLTDYQKSYLHLDERSKVIEISNIGEVERALSFLESPLRGEVRCRTADLLNGLFVAQKRGTNLVIDDNAGTLPEVTILHKGMIVVENVDDASPVIAVNYANSVGASILVVDPLPRNEKRNIPKWLQEWKDHGDCSKFEKLRDAVLQRIGGTSFTQFDYATFLPKGFHTP